MMNEFGRELIETLESYYHIQFEMEVTSTGSKTVYSVRPVGDNLFCVNFTFTQTRASIDFISDTGGILIHKMGHQPIYKRELFVKHYSLIEEEGYKATFKINGNTYDIHEYEQWPDDWMKVHFHITKIVNEYEDNLQSFRNICPVVFGMVLSLVDIVPNNDEWSHIEGSEKMKWIKNYERNSVNRSLCIAAKGTRCIVCGFDFEKTYGSIGKGFIHVHHLTPLCRMHGPRELNPLIDLVPVCPNCHNMLHRRDPPFEPDELKQIIFKSSNK